MDGLRRPPPLIRVRSESLCIDDDDDDNVTPPPTPLRRALSKLPSVRFSVTEGNAPDASSTPTSTPTPSPSHLFLSPRQPRRRLTIVIERRRTRTTIHVDVGVLVCVGVLLLITTAAGMVVGTRAPPSAGARRAVAPLGWATPDEAQDGTYLADGLGHGEPSSNPFRHRWPPTRQIGLTFAEMPTSGVRARLGVARFCLGLEQSLRRQFSELLGEGRAWGVLSWASEGACSLLFPVAFGEVARWRKVREPHARRMLIEVRTRTFAVAEISCPISPSLPLPVFPRNPTPTHVDMDMQMA